MCGPPGSYLVRGAAGNLEHLQEVRVEAAARLLHVHVEKAPGLSKTSLYALIREKSFPAPVRLGARTVAWLRSEVREWALERVRASRLDA